MTGRAFVSRCTDATGVGVSARGIGIELLILPF
jgi:hypothetical protein